MVIHCGAIVVVFLEAHSIVSSYIIQEGYHCRGCNQGFCQRVKWVKFGTLKFCEGKSPYPKFDVKKSFRLFRQLMCL